MGWHLTQYAEFKMRFEDVAITAPTHYVVDDVVLPTSRNDG